MNRRQTPLKAIRLKCLDCSGDSTKEVRLCPIKDCPIYMYRMGRNPNRTKGTTEDTQDELEAGNRAVRRGFSTNNLN
jgi:hypothetical protein